MRGAPRSLSPSVPPIKQISGESGRYMCRSRVRFKPLTTRPDSEGRRGEGLFQLVELLAFKKLFHNDSVRLFIPAIA